MTKGDYEKKYRPTHSNAPSSFDSDSCVLKYTINDKVYDPW